MEEMKILYLNTETTESVELGQLLAQRFLEDATIIVESFPSADATQVMIVGFLTQFQKERLQALERAFPQVRPEKDAKLRIYPMSIEPRAELPGDMKNYYHFREM